MYNLTISAGGSSNNPCSETYVGPMPFSEIETKSPYISIPFPTNSICILGSIAICNY